MPNTLYATFATESDAERAAAALIEYGVPANALRLLLPEHTRRAPETPLDIAPTASPAIESADAPALPDIPAPDPATVNQPHLPGLRGQRMTYENRLARDYARTGNAAPATSAWNDELETTALLSGFQTITAADLPAEATPRLAARLEAGNPLLVVTYEDPEVTRILSKYGATHAEVF